MPHKYSCYCRQTRGCNPNEQILAQPGQRNHLPARQPTKRSAGENHPAWRPIGSHNERVSTRASARIQPIRNNVANAAAPSSDHRTRRRRRQWIGSPRSCHDCGFRGPIPLRNALLRNPDARTIDSSFRQSGVKDRGRFRGRTSLQ